MECANENASEVVETQDPPGLTGQSQGKRAVRWGVLRECRKWIVEQSDLLMYVQYGRLGRLTLTERTCSLRRIEAGAWFARDDSVPFAAMCWASFVNAGRRLKGWTKAARVFQKLVAMVRRWHTCDMTRKGGREER